VTLYNIVASGCDRKKSKTRSQQEMLLDKVSRKDPSKKETWEWRANKTGPGAACGSRKRRWEETDL
jgi:hypothetical protein